MELGSPESIMMTAVDGITGTLTLVNLLRLLAIWVAYQVAVALYNISPWHPLSRFPGPKLAAMSFYYEAYYEFWLVGRYSMEIKRMHEKYGPIVRINPHELSFSDARFIDEIYAGGGRIRDKWQHFLNTGTVGPVAVGSFSTAPHEVHRMRRAPSEHPQDNFLSAFKQSTGITSPKLNRFFSRAQMLKLEAEVHDFTQRTCDKMLRTEGRFDVKEAYNCYTADIISQYAFGEPMGFIDQEGWEPNFGSWVKSFFNNAYMMRYVPLARKLVTLAPLVADYMGEDVRNVMRQLNEVIPNHIRRTLAADKGQKDGSSSASGRVFSDMINSPALPDEEKTIYRLSGEGFNLLSAGTETTAASLTCITFYLLHQPETYARLIDDLQGLDPKNLRWTELEQRPYLWAIIQESLRLLPGLAHRSSRIARDEDLLYRSEDGTMQCIIPKGTPMSMTPVLLHYNEKVFPEPRSFKPERWLLEDGRPSHALEKHLIPFSRGSRQCIGMNLAYCEMFLTTAAVALRVLPRAKLHSTLEDIEYHHDLIVPNTKHGALRADIEII